MTNDMTSQVPSFLPIFVNIEVSDIETKQFNVSSRASHAIGIPAVMEAMRIRRTPHMYNPAYFDALRNLVEG